MKGHAYMGQWFANGNSDVSNITTTGKTLTLGAKRVFLSIFNPAGSGFSINVFFGGETTRKLTIAPGDSLSAYISAESITLKGISGTANGIVTNWLY